MATTIKKSVCNKTGIVTITAISDRDNINAITETCENNQRAIDKTSKIILSKIKSSHRNLLPYKEGMNIYKGMYMNF